MPYFEFKMKLTHTLFLTAVLSTVQISAQQYNAYYQTLVDQVSSSNLQTNLTTFANFGEKQLGSSAQANALNWMIDLYQSWGYTDIQQHEVNSFGETGYNLIVTKTGTVYPDKYIIIDGHYDTINGPGANDNGSGTVILLELARILKDIPTEYSIKFIHFTAEEWGLIGSSQYVQEVVIPQNLDIRLVFNIDQVGGVAGEINDTISCERDQDSPNSNNAQSSDFTNQLMNCIEFYSDLETNLSYAYGSDYVPFQEEGFVITGLYEYNESPYPHSSQDTLGNVDFEFIHQVAKGSLGALSHFAVVQENMSVNDLNSGAFQVFPNPADKSLTVKTNSLKFKSIQMNDLTGKLILEKNSSEKEFKVDTSHLPNGIYLMNYTEEGVKSTQKIIVQHK